MGKKRRKRRKYSRSFDPSRIFVNIVDYFRYRKSLLVIAGIVLFLLLAAIIAVKYVADNYTVTNVYVTGNTHYSNEEIMDMVIDGELDKNSVYLSLKYRNRTIENIPFIEKMSVEILAPDTVRINVYEKAVAGYIQYLGIYMYFDSD